MAAQAWRSGVASLQSGGTEAAISALSALVNDLASPHPTLLCVLGEAVQRAGFQDQALTYFKQVRASALS